MHGKKPQGPMTRIQERAPEDKWMRNADVTPSPIHQQSGIVDGADIYRRQQQEKAAKAPQQQQGTEVTQPAPSSGAPEVFEGSNAMNLERRTAAAAAEQSRADTLEAEKLLLEEKLTLTEKSLSDVQSNTGDLRTRVKKLKTDLGNERTQGAQAQKLLGKAEAKLKEAQEDRRQEATEYTEKISAAQTRISELEARDPAETGEVEVEVYPDRIVIDEITNTIRKGGTIILKTQVKMDDEMVPMTIRAPFKKMKAAVDRGDRSPKNEEDDEE